MNFHDAETLSAYLDGQLSPADARQLQGRLASDPNLKAVLDDMRLSRRVLAKLPKRRAPHNFTLTRSMKGVRAPEPPAVWGLRFASLLATLLLLATFALNGVTPLAPVSLASAPRPANGIGGSGGGPPTTELPPQSFAAAAPTQGAGSAATPAPQDLIMPTAVAPAEAAPKAVSPSAGSPEQARTTEPRRVPALLQVLLAGVAILCGGFAWDIQRRSRRQFRSRWLQK
jgi:hypothetical protein